MLDRAGGLDVGKGARLAGVNTNRRRNLPALTKAARVLRAHAVGRHAALALFAREVFGADGARLGRRQAREISEMKAEAVEHGSWRLEVGSWRRHRASNLKSE